MFQATYSYLFGCKLWKSRGIIVIYNEIECFETMTFATLKWAKLKIDCLHAFKLTIFMMIVVMRIMIMRATRNPIPNGYFSHITSLAKGAFGDEGAFAPVALMIRSKIQDLPSSHDWWAHWTPALKFQDS